MNGYRKATGHGDWLSIENEVWRIIERPMHEPGVGAVVEASHLFDGDPYAREMWVRTEKGWQSLSGGSFVKDFSKLLHPRLVREKL